MDVPQKTSSLIPKRQLKKILMSKRAITLLVLLLCCFALHLEAKNTFVRVFNLEGHLIAKGDLITATDTSVIIQQNKEQVEIPVSGIGFIKTARPFGHAVVIGAGVGLFIGLIAGAAAGSSSGTGDFAEFDESVSIAAGSSLGLAGGAVIGTIISASQKRKKIEVNGDLNAWQQKKQLLNAMIPSRQ
jgi:hypothetical protein